MSTIALSGSARACGNLSGRTARARPLAIMRTAAALPGGLALADLAGLARRLPLVLDVDGGQPRLLPLSRGTADTVLATLLAAVAESVASGSWERLKICRNPDCRWAYYDRSRNRSRAWCSMALCGNRAKARAFRSRGR